MDEGIERSRHLILLMVLAVTAIGCKMGSATKVKSLAVAVPAGFVSHHSKDGNVELKAPPSWHEENGDRAEVILDLLPEDHHSGFNVVMLGPPPHHDLQAILDSLATRKLKGFKMLKSEFIRVSNTDSVRYVAEADAMGKLMIIDQTIIPMRSHTYYLTFMTPPDRYGADAAASLATLASFGGQP